MKCSKRNFDIGRNHWHSTTLQRRLNSVYESSKTQFGSKNKEYLKVLSQITGNSGYSHLTRVDKITNWINFLGQSLTSYERAYVNNLLREYKSYLTETRKLSNGKTRLKRKTSNVISTVKKVNDLTRIFEDTNYKQILQKAEEIQKKENIRIIPIQTYQTSKPQNSLLKRTGKVITKGLVGIATVAIIGLGGYLARDYQRVSSQKSEITRLTQEIQSEKEKSRKSVAEKNAKVEDLTGMIIRENTKICELEKRCNNLEDEKSTSDIINKKLAEIVKGYVEENQKTAFQKLTDKSEGWLDEEIEYAYRVPSSIAGTPEKETKQSNKERRNFNELVHMAETWLEQKPIISIMNYESQEKIPKINTIQKAEVKRRGFNDYGKYLGRKGAAQWKQGKPIESLLTGFGSWLALGNDCLRNVTAPVIKTAGGISRTVEKTIFGNPKKENTWKKGKEDAEKINDFFWRNWWGGVNWNNAHAGTLEFATLGNLDFGRKYDSYVIDDGIPGTAMVIGSNIALGSIINCISDGGSSSYRSSGGIEIIGGEVDGGGIISGGVVK